ncbi:MAG: Smr/MutS family protein [Balneolaceae bacterium]|nr:Smr/MutS family protein [Balneolaceae bacterium]
MSSGEPTELPIDGTLDLHTFRPEDLGSLIPDYIEACIDKGIYQLRIIHGKGTGSLRRSVHALLDRNPKVSDYKLAGDRSGWGATLVELKQDHS